MGFLDDAITKTKEVFDVACKKTDEIVTVEKQRFNIASLKTKREKDYIELGKIYFNMIKDDYEDANEEVRNLVCEIIQKNEEIERLTEEIQNIKSQGI